MIWNIRFSTVILYFVTLHVKKVVTGTGCDVLLTSSSGEITSPNYPNAYGPNLLCDYTIKTDPASIIRLTTWDLKLESTEDGPRCFDFIEFYDGDNINAPFIGRYCGIKGLPPPIRSSHNSLLVRFKTDHSYQFSGFYGNYSIISPSVTDVSVRSVSNSSVSVQWKGPDSTFTVHNYTVTVKPVAHRHLSVPGCPALPPLQVAVIVVVNGSTSATVVHLPTDLEFQVSVVATTAAGQGPPSDVVMGYTLPAASEAVRDLNVLMDTSDKVTFNWKAPCDSGGALSHFVVVLEADRMNQNSENFIFNQTVTQPMQESYSTSMFISNLTAECMYNVTVIPVGLHGIYGANQTTSFHVPARASEPVRDLSVKLTDRDDSVTFTWRAPRDSGGVLGHFLVVLEADRKNHRAENYMLNHTVTQPLQDSYSTSMLLFNLTAECMYNVTVIPVGLHGLYGANQTTSFLVPARASGPVRDLNVEITDRADTVTFTWRAPSDSGGVLSHFRVILEAEWEHQSAEDYILNQTVTQPLKESYSISTLLSNLTAECMYNVTVIPVGLHGLYGANQTTSFQVPAREPTEPQNVSATALSTSAVVVRWEPPAQSHGTLTNYIVTLQPLSHAHPPTPPLHTAVVTVSGSTLQTQFNHLLADIQFQVTVTAATAASQGPPSVPFFIHTPPQEKVPTEPQNVSSTALSGSAVRVLWEPPAQSHGTLSNYTVTLQPLAFEPLVHSAVVTVNGSTLQTDIDHLKEDTEYEVTVTAATSAGPGPPSAVSLVHTPPKEKVPTEPQNVSSTALSGSSVRVLWEPPTQSHGTLTNYTVTMQQLAFEPLVHLIVVTVNGSTLQTVIDHLKEDTEYQVTVTAATSAGPGPPSAVCLVHTHPKEKVPTEPQNVSSTALSGSAVRVLWEPPAQSHGTLTNYIVTLQPLAFESLVHSAVVTVNGSTLQTVIDHLKEDTEYQVTVTAATSAGPGPPSAVSLVHTPLQEKGKMVPVVLVLEILAGVVAAGIVLLIVTWWVVSLKRKNTHTCARHEVDCDKGLALDDLLQCDYVGCCTIVIN